MESLLIRKYWGYPNLLSGNGICSAALGMIVSGESDWIAGALSCKGGLPNRETARTRTG